MCGRRALQCFTEEAAFPIRGAIRASSARDSVLCLCAVGREACACRELGGIAERGDAHEAENGGRPQGRPRTAQAEFRCAG